MGRRSSYLIGDIRGKNFRRGDGFLGGKIFLEMSREERREMQEAEADRLRTRAWGI